MVRSEVDNKLSARFRAVNKKTLRAMSGRGVPLVASRPMGIPARRSLKCKTRHVARQPAGQARRCLAKIAGTERRKYIAQLPLRQIRMGSHDR